MSSVNRTAGHVMIRTLVLLTLCALTLSACDEASGKRGPIRPKHLWEYKHSDFCINFPDNFFVSKITDMALTIDKDPNNSNRTVWALSFNTCNLNHDVEGSFQGVIGIYFETASNSPVFMPNEDGPDYLNAGAPGGGIYHWRDACYF